MMIIPVKCPYCREKHSVKIFDGMIFNTIITCRSCTGGCGHRFRVKGQIQISVEKI